MCIHQGVDRTQSCTGNISTKAGTPINVAGCSRRSLATSLNNGWRVIYDGAPLYG